MFRTTDDALACFLIASREFHLLHTNAANNHADNFLLLIFVENLIFSCYSKRFMIFFVLFDYTINFKIPT